MKRIALAADLGGTNLRVAAVSESGEIISRSSVATPPSKSFDDVSRTIIELARELIKDDGERESIEGFGIAVPALIDQMTGKIIKAPNLPDLDGNDLAASVALGLGVSAVLENDATAAAIGENWKGASKDFSTSICVTLGTGVGGGLTIDGRVFKGIDGTAGEVGHMVVEPFGHPCSCGSNGCLEQYASAQALVRIFYELRPDYLGTMIGSETAISSGDIYEAGVKGDELAIAVFKRMGFYLGVAFAGIVNVLNPEAIVIGGGVANGWDLFAPEIERQISARAFQQPAERVKLIRAKLGDDAALVGMASSVFAFERKAI
jgi:glucokinase